MRKIIAFTFAIILGSVATKVYGCNPGQSCAGSVQITYIDTNNNGCRVVGGVCGEYPSTTTRSCSAAPACSASFFRCISCSNDVTSCGCDAWDTNVSCCYTPGGPTPTGGGGGGPGPPAICNGTDVVIPYVPTIMTCQSVGACRMQSDGTGGEAGISTGEPVCAGSAANNNERYDCQRGYCGSACTPACGNTTNGCGYETFGCSGSCAPNTGACFWPARVTGQRVAINGVLPIGVPVTFNATSIVANPSFSFNLADTIPGTTRQISVPSDVNYDIAKTTCYNNTTCHATAVKNPGTQTDILDDQIRLPNNMTVNRFADVRFHYCLKLGAVNILTPGGTACVATPPTAPTTMSWGIVTGATSYHVVVRENGVIVSDTNINAPTTSLPVNVTFATYIPGTVINCGFLFG